MMIHGSTLISSKILLFLVLVFSLCWAVSASVELTIDEGGKIISFYDQYYIYQIKGNISISNPSNQSLYNINIPIYSSTLDIRSNSTDNRYSLTNEGIFIFALGPQQSVDFTYRIVGISTEDFNVGDQTVLGYGISLLQPKIYSNIMGTLRKAPLEDVDGGGHENTRLISVEFRNPTSFVYTIEKVEVIKTAGMDPSNELDSWSFSDEKSTLDAFEGWSFDFLDSDAYEGEIYWLSTEIYLGDVTIIHNENITRYNQDDLFVVLSNTTLNDSYPNASTSLLQDRIFLRKLISSPLVNPGDIMNVTVVINSLEPRTAPVSVKDVIPEGFSIISIGDDGVENDDGSLSWSKTLPSNSVTRLKYQIRYDDSDSLGVDYFRPAELTFGDNVYYSQSVPFVRKYVPEKKVFVQKKISFLGGDEVRVSLSVHNFGESVLSDIVIKEHLLGASEFREISQPFVSRGVWRIQNLSQGSLWETSYITDSTNVFNVFPDVFGLPQGSVLQSIILSNMVESSYSLFSTKVAETFALVALSIIVLLYFLPANFFSRERKRQAEDLKAISHEIHHLKQHSLHSPPSVSSSPSSHALSQSGVPLDPTTTAQPHTHHKEDPARVARQKALDDATLRLKKSKEHITGKKEESSREPTPK